MFKQLVIAMVLLGVLACATPIYAIDDVGFGAGVMTFVEKGKDTEMGWMAKGRFPWGINKKMVTKVNQFKADTTLTFEVMSEVVVVWSDFQYKDYGEVEAEVVINKVRKSMGFWNLSLEGAQTVWHFRSTESGNVVADGYYAGFNYQPFNDWKVFGGGHVIPVSDKRDTYVFQLGVTIIL